MITLLNFRAYALWSLLLPMLMISCKEESNSKNFVQQPKELIQEIKSEMPTIDTAGMIEKLQGKWKETEYPFRLAHFNKTTVKFVDEGMVEEPTYQEFKILSDCPFKVNNIKNAGSGDIFLVMAHAGTCEILNISNDTLTLSGFSTNTSSDYRIIYRKEE